MSPDLRKQLEALHAELAKTSSVEPESRELLVALLGDIARLIDPSAPNPADEHSVPQRLDEMAVRFEAEHPSLGTAIRRVVDALAKAGI